MTTTTIRRGTAVLSWCSDLGIGRVEGTAYPAAHPAHGGRPHHIVRWANGYVGRVPVGAGRLTAVDAATTLVPDQHNNLGRHCSVDATSGRRWEVEAAVSGSRYLVVNLDTDEVRIVGHFRMSNLY